MGVTQGVCYYQRDLKSFGILAWFRDSWINFQWFLQPNPENIHNGIHRKQKITKAYENNIEIYDSDSRTSAIPAEIPSVVDIILNLDVQPLEREYILFYEVNK